MFIKQHVVSLNQHHKHTHTHPQPHYAIESIYSLQLQQNNIRKLLCKNVVAFAVPIAVILVVGVVFVLIHSFVYTTCI